MMMMMLPSQQGGRELGIPSPSIAAGGGGGGGDGDIKEKLNTSGTTEQCTDCSTDNENKSSNHSSLLCSVIYLDML